MRVVSYLELGEKVVICCRAGVSRSNAIALGVLVHHFKIDVNQALADYQSPNMQHFTSSYFCSKQIAECKV